MKAIICILILTFLSLFSFSQDDFAFKNYDTCDCSKYLKIQTDKFTGKKHIESQYIIHLIDVNDGSDFSISMKKLKGYYSEIIANLNSSCVDEGSKLYILFRDGEKAMFKNIYFYNCNGLFSSYVRILTEGTRYLDYLKTKEIESIKFEAYSRTFQADFTEEQSILFMTLINCFSEQKLTSP